MPLNFQPETTVSEQRGLMMRRLLILFASMVCGLLVTSVLMAVVGSSTTAHVRILTMLQDILMFIFPAILTAMLTTRLPADFMGLNHGFRLSALIIAVCVLAVSVPLQNFIIQWNASVQLPPALSGVEEWMRASEDRAAESMQLLMGGTSVADLIINILIVGVFAGVSEELFFRGALQRILRGNRRNAHAAIWVAAFIFSVFHFQFYGFVPRLLLGALFGYLLWWSGSVWLPVVIHALNNTAVVTTEWHSRVYGGSASIDSIGADNMWLVAASLLLTAAGLWLLRRSCLTVRRQ